LQDSRERRETLLRAIFAICVLCFALAVYSGHRIVSETHLHTADEPWRVPGVPPSPHRDSIAALEQAQRIRASRLATAAAHPSSALDLIMATLSGR
jgi:hypothetical protein